MHYGGAGYGAQEISFPGKVQKPFGLRRFKRMNVIALLSSLFIPWLVGCSTMAFASFGWHYRQPLIYSIVCTIVGGLLGVFWLRATMRYFKSDDFAVQTGILTDNEYHPELGNKIAIHEEKKAGSWAFFILTMSFLFFIAGLLVGNKNFVMNTQPYYDLTNLLDYSTVNPETVRGQEMMDAGTVEFVNSATVDLKRIMSFRNMDTYCVAPITTGVPLQSYDFWAVGLNCCGDGQDGSNFTCGDVEQLAAHGAVRVVRNDDRAFYRLAVQQAQSAYNIRANHPLFFYWSAHPKVTEFSYFREGFRRLYTFMYGGFLLQVLLVSIIAGQFVPVRS
jgi:hypothetical protein